MNDTFAIEPSGDREIVIARTFKAPAARVFAAYTTPALVQRWLLGPDGWTMPVCEIELRIGGALHYVWRHADGREFGLTGTFREIDAPHRLVHTELFDMDWTGGEALVTTVFTEAAGVTTVRMTILYASPEARDGAARSGMEQGVARSYERLDGILDEVSPSFSTPRIVEVEAAFAAIVRTSIPMAEIPAAQRAARTRLAALSTRAGVPPLGARLTIWRPPTDGRIDYAPGILVPHPFDPPHGIDLTELPAGRAAHLRLEGPYAGLPEAWAQLFAACEAEGWMPAGLNWEIYGSGEAPAGGTTDLYALLT